MPHTTMVTRVRVLYVTHQFPFPLASGLLRHYFLIRELSKYHQVTLFSGTGPSFELSHLDALSGFVERIEHFPIHSGPLTPVWARAGLGFFGPGKEMGRAVRREARSGAFDVIIAGKWTLPFEPGVPILGDVCDATSARVRGSIRYRPARAPVLLVKYFMTRRVEHALVDHSGHSMFISARDRTAVLGDTTKGTSIVPNGVDVDYWRRISPHLGSDTVIFTGAMDYPPNANAASHLIRAIFPIVRKALPDARLLIVGRDPGPDIRATDGRDGVTVTGYVDDMRPFLEQATLMAAPIRFGSGLQNKLLEAMAMGVPVIASSVAAAGIQQDSATHPIKVADTPETMSREIIQRLRALAHDPEPDHAARQFVSAHHSWEVAGRQLAHLVDEVAQG